MMGNHTTILLKSIDQYEPFNQLQRLRGWGGLAILYQQDISIQSLETGSVRTMATRIMTKGKPVCLINVYLPTNGHKTSNADYIKELEKLASIIEMHRSDHDILIIGDFNASITRTTPNTNDKLLRSFVAGNALVADKIEAPSFRHHDGKKSSKIDYLMTTEHSTHLVRSVLLLEDDLRNTPSHVPLSAQCTLAEQFCTVSAPKPRQTTTAAVRVPQWDLADPTTFQHMSRNI